MTKKQSRRAKTTRRLGVTGLASAGLVFASFGPGALGQQNPGNNAQIAGFFASVDLVNSLQFTDDNGRASTDVRLNITSQTRNQRLTFQTGTGIDIPLSDDGEIRSERPVLRFEFVRDNGATEVSSLLSYRRVPVDGFVPTDVDDTGFGAVTVIDEDTGDEIVSGDFDEQDLVRDEGDREDISFGLSLECAKRRSVGFGIEVAHQQRNFIDIDDPDLFDTMSTDYTAFARFTINPRVTARLNYNYDLSESDGESERERTSERLGGSVSWRASPLLSFSGSLSSADVETTLNDGAGGRVTETEEGVDYSASLRYRRPNGSITASASRSINSNGAVDEYSVGRSLAFRNGSLTANAGVSTFDDGESFPSFGLSYGRQTKRGRISVAARQFAGTTSEDLDAIFSSVTASYRENLTATSSVTFTAGYNTSNVVDSFETDRQSTRFGLTYRQDVTRDWDLAAGYQYREARRGGDGAGNSNRVFINLERTFQVRP